MKNPHAAAIVCTGPSIKELDRSLLRNYTGMVYAVNWAVRIGHKIGADIFFAQDGAWLMTEKDCKCVVRGKCKPCIGLRGRPKDILRFGRIYRVGDMATLPSMFRNAQIYRLAGNASVGGFQKRKNRLPGYNSGFSAINLALHHGAKRIVLLGFDCSRSDDAYWPERKNTARDNEPRKAWRAWINDLDLMQLKTIWNAEVVNGTPQSHCDKFRITTPEEGLQWSVSRGTR